MTAPIRILLVGAEGRMGRALAGLIAADAVPGLQVVAALDRPDNPHQGEDIGQLAIGRANGVQMGSDFEAALQAHPDVAIDFSFHVASAALAPRIARTRLAWVLGTTGLTPDEQAAIDRAAQTIPVLQAANMSVGINLLHALTAQAADILRGRGYDCEIIERHHRHKKDAPSGTALFLGQAVADANGWNLPDVAMDGRSGMPGERPENQIGFHAVRGGDIVGDHTVLFATDGECIELSHRATSRDTLARGALRAAAWIAGRAPGRYGMADVLGISLPKRS